MKSLGINWAEFLNRLPLWESLSVESRRTFASLKGTDGVGKASFRADSPAMIEGQVLQPFVYGDRVRVHPEAHDFNKAIRAMGRHELLTRHDPRAHADYISDQFTGDQCGSMLGSTWQRQNRGYGSGWGYGYSDGPSHHEVAQEVSKLQWLDGFLALRDYKAAKKWEADRMVPKQLGAALRGGGLDGQRPDGQAAL